MQKEYVDKETERSGARKTGRRDNVNSLFTCLTRFLLIIAGLLFFSSRREIGRMRGETERTCSAVPENNVPDNSPWQKTAGESLVICDICRDTEISASTAVQKALDVQHSDERDTHRMAFFP